MDSIIAGLLDDAEDKERKPNSNRKTREVLE
jgi:hypothetical protein